MRLLSIITEELNYKKLYEAYSSRVRNHIVDSKILFKTVIYSYINDILVSKQIEDICKRDNVVIRIK